MDVKALTYYVAIVDQKSINKAAEILYISQPVLSRTVQALEDELGVQLLIRTNHGIEMTPVGQSLYYYAHSILSQFDEIERLKKTYHAVVETRLLVSTAMLLLQDVIVQDYFKAAPSDHAVINIQETGIEQAIKNVSDQVSEIAIMTLNSVQHRVMTRVIKIQGLQMHSIKKDAVYVHLAQTHPLAQQSTIATSELLDMTYPADDAGFLHSAQLHLQSRRSGTDKLQEDRHDQQLPHDDQSVEAQQFIHVRQLLASGRSQERRHRFYPLGNGQCVPSFSLDRTPAAYFI